MYYAWMGMLEQQYINLPCAQWPWDGKLWGYATGSMEDRASPAVRCTAEPAQKFPYAELAVWIW